MKVAHIAAFKWRRTTKPVHPNDDPWLFRIQLAGITDRVAIEDQVANAQRLMVQCEN
ncbi:MAG: hypothetical protein HYV60_24875 [Planctomycetia bacterium]|nr:hypothetical protein [Planctomycetia bacterium]